MNPCVYLPTAQVAEGVQVNAFAIEGGHKSGVNALQRHQNSTVARNCPPKAVPSYPPPKSGSVKFE